MSRREAPDRPRKRNPTGPDWRPMRRDTRARSSFASLSANAKLYYVFARLDMHSSGIDICYPGGVAGAASLTLEQANAAEAELVAAGEARRDGAVLWIVHGLNEHQGGSFIPENHRHRRNVEQHLDKLPSQNLATDFRAHYVGWFGPVDKATGPAEQLDLMPKVRVVGAEERKPAVKVVPYRMGTGTVPHHRVQNTENPLNPPGFAAPASGETSPEEVSRPPLDSSATRPATANLETPDPDLAFEELHRAALADGYDPFALTGMPPPVAAGLRAVGGLTRLRIAPESELPHLRGAFRRAFAKLARPPDAKEAIA